MANAKVSFTVRLPPNVHKKLKQIAARELRSLQSQILKAIEEHIHRRNATP